ncbi:SH3-like domain-containing protein [Pseudorhizobium tarimense]|uniref:SH3-like domain-containing protein n=1 Tax=Pseudorhizobium tarimense TaxID=1079109 RepID=A0ABV2H6N3_9HYPH|nr:SH3 domain-containing protein [Pseudorhizobium tarimense]MCJ8519458.1 SH3 domain-containing protein [Pseudorhizobium tarimense]
MLKDHALAAGTLLALALAVVSPHDAAAQAGAASGFTKGRETGFAVPRYVSLKASRARMRIGPSTDYATKWIYTHRGMPLEITEEYGNWRRVRDYDGVSGWMYGSLLSGDRTAMIGPWLKEPVVLRKGPSSATDVVAKLSPKVMMSVTTCDGTWCNVVLKKAGMEGYVEQASLWGVYPGEHIE